MADSIENYRAAIGLFYCRTGKPKKTFDFRCDLYQEILLTNLRCTYLVVSLILLQSLNPNINIVFLLFIIQFILIIGNVEANPGPELQDVNGTNSEYSDNFISVCNINIRSIRNKLEFLHNFMDEFDVVTVTETHLDPTVSDDDLILDSFSKNIFRKDRNNAGGGLLIYIKDDIAVHRRRELENHVDETIWVEVRGKGQNFLLCNTYRPEWTDAEYWTRLNHAIEIGYQINCNIVITGDLNSNLYRIQNNKLIDTMNMFNLENVINKPTRVTDTHF